MKQLLTLVLPAENYAKPIIYHLIKEYNIKITILKAEIIPKKQGYLLIEAEGAEASLQNALQFLAQEQIKTIPDDKQTPVYKIAGAPCNTCAAACFSDAIVVNKQTLQQESRKETCIIRAQKLLTSVLGPKPEKTAKHVPHCYQNNQEDSELRHFAVNCNNTGLWISVNNSVYSAQFEQDSLKHANKLCTQLADYIAADAPYASSLKPYQPQPSCPPIARLMADVTQIVGVGPLTAAAGAFPQEIARRLETKYAISDLIIENGDGIYLRSRTPRRIMIPAGRLPQASQLCLEIDPCLSPLGICTSSGTAGTFFNLGKADAVTVLAKDAALASAYATAIGNMIKNQDDIATALEYSAAQSAILGIVIIIGDKISCQGNINLVPAECFPCKADG